MSQEESSTPALATAAAATAAELESKHGANLPNAGRSGIKTSVTTAVAAAALVAATVFSGPSFVSQADSILSSPANSSASRIAGVQQDMARAVALQQLTSEQAAFLEKQLIKGINGSQNA